MRGLVASLPLYGLPIRLKREGQEEGYPFLLGRESQEDPRELISGNILYLFIDKHT